MPRPKLKLDETAIIHKRLTGLTLKEIARDMKVSAVTISRLISEIKNKKGLLIKYRELQGLRLTALQFRLLDCMSPEKIKDASLPDLIRAFWILFKAEGAIKGKDSFKIHGLVDYLMEIEKEK